MQSGTHTAFTGKGKNQAKRRIDNYNNIHTYTQKKLKQQTNSSRKNRKKEEKKRKNETIFKIHMLSL